MSLVTVIIPTYYRNEGLENAIESVLRQTYANIEIIVVDDSGEAHAEPVCNQFDVVYIDKNENEGPMAAWNEGIRLAKGEYIQILDDDDELFSEKIEKQVELFNKNDGMGVAHCGMRWDFGVDKFPNPKMRGDVLSQVLTLDTSPCVTSTMLIDCDLLEEIHPINEYQGAADDVLKIELAQRSDFDFVDEILVLRGTGGDNISTSMSPVIANKQILRDYSSVYNQVDSIIRQKALSKTLYREGYAHLDDNIWSADAVICFARSIYECPTRSLRSLILLPLSLGGRPAISLFEQVGAWAKNMLQSIS